MEMKSIALVMGLATTALAGTAQGQQTQFSIDDLVNVGSIEFGLSRDSRANSITLNLPTERVAAADIDAGALSGASATPFVSSRSGDQAARLRDLIAHAEAGSAGYDAVQHGARRLPPKRPTDMTVGEIFAWIKATPGQPHAIGRYQFIPKTLRGLLRRSGVGPQQRFSPALQDHLANLLLEDAGFAKFKAGRISDVKFMYNLAGIWAGLPLPSGRSRYHGYAGNSATIKWSSYKAEMARIFPR
ncbi:hypothetical protein Q4577_12995 [Marinovum sp. 2_MG-2023]|uniref:hypothetical protein n=1 Tax=unclassified Marinovum TaxID=2647166 RepID=UPI0026E29AEC|nr:MULTISPECIES: hypothetical protein [unclassified Marinovum]MDO6730942.1 hypothetical protein [Marinovum sp. 2_MG-2023]MDO6780169.1 hypothetical protein [Marinovum sp. 1_MG-2023]